VVSPSFLRHGTRTYDELREGGYTESVVYMAEQIQQFQLQGKEFAMQHLGSEEEIRQAWREILSKCTVEERLAGMEPGDPAWREVLSRCSPEERLAGLPPEERLKGLTPEERKRLRELLDREAGEDLSPKP
jgi:hypothetical protein